MPEFKTDSDGEVTTHTAEINRSLDAPERGGEKEGERQEREEQFQQCGILS